MTDTNLSDLTPELQKIAQKCLSDWIIQYPTRIPVKILTTWRSPVDQQAAYEAGLSKCKAGEGKHNCTTPQGLPASEAFDFACFDEDGTYITDGTDGYYADFGDIAKANGLVWGGDWTGFKDYDHVELPN